MEVKLESKKGEKMKDKYFSAALKEMMHTISKRPISKDSCDYPISRKTLTGEELY